MFSRDTDASKVALVYLAASLKLGAYRFIDTQFITKHLVRFGAKEIPRSEYRILLSDALATRAAFVRTVDPGYVTSILSG